MCDGLYNKLWQNIKSKKNDAVAIIKSGDNEIMISRDGKSIAGICKARDFKNAENI